jgi:RimJ/RimL family protein N-acetyltransferase
MENIIIRKMKLEDYISMHKNLFTKMMLEDVKTNVVNNVQTMEQESPGWDYFVAEYSNEVIAITYIKYSISMVNSHVVELLSIVTQEQFQGKGVFKSIFNHILEYLETKKIEKIILTVRKGVIAETVYQKLGFIKYGELPKGIKEKGEYIDQVHYYYDIKGKEKLNEKN